jgi:8-oxo-dGTP pyrophosphatase MutT (NUDIX family)
MTQAITLYVSMLMFSSDRKKVALITKNRPAFLDGKLCPVGGRIENGEEPIEAAVREYLEETGVPTAASDWMEYAVGDAPGSIMHCFVAFNDSVFDCRTGQDSLTDEPVSIWNVADILSDVVNNPELAYKDFIAMIGLALQAGVREGFARLSYE